MEIHRFIIVEHLNIAFCINSYYSTYLFGAVLKLETHGSTLETEAVESDIGAARLLLGGELDEAEVEPLLAALEYVAERTKDLNEVVLLQCGVQVANEQCVVQTARAAAAARRRRRRRRD